MRSPRPSTLAQFADWLAVFAWTEAMPDSSGQQPDTVRGQLVIESAPWAWSAALGVDISVQQLAQLLDAGR